MSDSRSHKTMDRLQGLPYLPHIDIRETQVSEKRIKEFAEAKPNCEIVTDYGTFNQ